ncbi:VOC family protein [Paracoccus ravus]|uniref:VOC family protein n=1 Tax=Paracoccus ravus TaxID=2447760 RepID=UPI00106EF8BF|nr:VOC family protein [Paracoccus ravus]
MASSDGPIQIGRVALRVKDLHKVSAFYQRIIGLAYLRGDGEQHILGVGDLALLDLRSDRAARHHSNEAGLFHTAFLLPDRVALGSWLRFAAANRVSLDGASDHLVSEALYLHDPEGNGIEIYADRPRDDWRHHGGEVVMDTRPLDLAALQRIGSDDWQAAPNGTVIGHVHLQVGNIAKAEDFYTSRLGMDRTSHRPGASFFGSGGYHHHLAGNIWNSRAAGQRRPDTAGLAEIVLQADATRLDQLGAGSLADPWGTEFRIEAKARTRR